MMMPTAMETLMGGFEFGEDRCQGRIDQQLGRFQVLMKGQRLLMQGLPLGRGRASFTFAAQRLELLLEARLFGLKRTVGGEGCRARLVQLGSLGFGQDRIMVLPPASTPTLARARGPAARRSGGRCRIGESCRDACGGQREGHEGHSRD